MTQEEILDLARQAGVAHSDQLHLFADAVASAQRERCSTLIWRARADWMKHNDWQPHQEIMALLARIEHEVRRG